MATSLHQFEPPHDGLRTLGYRSQLLSDSEVRRNARDERLSAIGETTAEFVHQIRTPLATAMLYAGQLDLSVHSQARLAGKILAGLNDVNRMVNNMLGFAAGIRAEHVPVNVFKLLNDVRESIDGQLAHDSTIRVSVGDSSLGVAVNEDAVKGALLNLVNNADQASPGGVNILLHGHCFDNCVHLCVTDDGPGIPADVKPRLFDAFFTTRSQGTGLGLSVVKAVASAHDGDVFVDSSHLGSSFSIQLPQLRGPAVSQ